MKCITFENLKILGISHFHREELEVFGKTGQCYIPRFYRKVVFQIVLKSVLELEIGLLYFTQCLSMYVHVSAYLNNKGATHTRNHFALRYG